MMLIEIMMRRKKRTKRRRVRRRRAWHSKLVHHLRARPSKIHQIKRFGKFMVKKGYRARRKKSSSKNKEESRRCFKCGSKDRLVAQCPYNSDIEMMTRRARRRTRRRRTR